VAYPVTADALTEVTLWIAVVGSIASVIPPVVPDVRPTVGPMRDR